MAFFRNSAVNLLNLHYGLHCIALYGGGAFFLAYLLRAGLAVPGVLVSLALILVGRFTVRPLVILLAARWGLRATLVAGTLLSALQYPVVAEVRGIGAICWRRSPSHSRRHVVLDRVPRVFRSAWRQ